ncbi:unnamed protein product [Neospora caninum Liverpool]|uniref:Apical membrane antigen, putative n=1 Tax=Neospora caninum (strain Liverpool) TaxID=572307 RepID=F0VQN6_NEOCL|nr:uncharacterized protein NCLIV_064590 [Neospora caninum Liverpool]CBZ56033.1 unnamed protein product [Neospora caninum Liverpool]CEL70780.1 TPA: apical membrane antigen, putative [Neospora caninum Liverpool]|eukprot:XP_003886059.1 uncharacterized protein NCLIV_064590 [Neospora caninum Liverpool]
MAAIVSLLSWRTLRPVVLVLLAHSCSSDALNVDRLPRPSRLALAETAATPEINPWAGLLEKYNVPLVHGSGVYVDLGNTKRLHGKNYREPGGLCPNFGKYIETHQPTRNAEIWPNNFLKPVPYAKSAQDTKPLGGGFAMPMTVISPKSLDELKYHAQTFDKKPDASDYAKKFVKDIKDDLGYCIWWARMTSVHDSDAAAVNMSKEDYYRYAFAYDAKNSTCHIMYLNMQEMTGAGTYCKNGDSGPDLSWYCFNPKKSVDSGLVWGSAYARLDHATACPEHGLKNVHWGQWNGVSCQRMAVRKRISVSDAAECATQLFANSPSDNPTKYVGDEGRGLDKIYKDFVAVLFPAGAGGSDQPHSRGAGVNWANFYKAGNTCEMYDGVPDCLTSAPGQYAFVSLADPDPNNAQLPPCTQDSDGISIPSNSCTCAAGSLSGTTAGAKCEDGKWIDSSVPCTCEPDEEDDSVNVWLIAGPCIAAAVLLLGGAAYWIARRKKEEPEVGKPNIVDETREHAVRARQNQADLLQEAEPSFWGEAASQPTNVILEPGAIDRDF